MTRKEQHEAWEREDRAKSPHAWAIHDHAMRRASASPDVSRVLLKGMFVIILILLAIIITT